MILATAVTSLMAFSIDTLLPAMVAIGHELAPQNINRIQWLVTALLASTAAGGLLAGPLADRWGRLPVAVAGGALFLAGSALAYLATSCYALLLARVIQGLGVAGTRIAMHAITRDRFRGDELARVLSFSTGVFLLVPLVAPALGQWMLQATGTWRSVFALQALIATASLVWLLLRQQETKPRSPKPAAPVALLATYREIWRLPEARRYLLASCIALTPLMSYLTLAPQLLQVQYQFGDRFALVFALLALPAGLAAIASGLLVTRYGALSLLRTSLAASALASCAFLPLVVSSAGHPSTTSMLLYLALAQATFGLNSGNVTALAMSQLGAYAASGAALLGALAAGVSAVLAALVTSTYDASPFPLVACTLACSLASLYLIRDTATPT